VVCFCSGDLDSQIVSFTELSTYQDTRSADQYDSISRWLHLGSTKRFQLEDYVMVFVFVSVALLVPLLCLIDLHGFYTNLIICMNIVAHLDTNLMLPSDIPLLTPESIKSRIRGSKYVLVVEQSMIMTIWSCKICLLLMYSKLTFGLKQQWAVKAVGVYVVLDWIIMESLYFGVVSIARFLCRLASTAEGYFASLMHFPYNSN
jgi:hypothetical protein